MHTHFISHNQSAWDEQARAQKEWSTPVSTEQVEQAKLGNWDVHLTPKPVDKNWFGDIKGKNILCLASAGGQQAPILAAAGAIVTVFDFSLEQLNKDLFVANRDNISLVAVQGDMRDLSCFEDESFDLVFHPISNHYISEVNLVWSEAYRVLKKGGALLSSFFNPIVFIAGRDATDFELNIIRPKYKLPYSDLVDLDEAELKAKMDRNEALVFGHTLTELIGGQTKAGFVIADFTEEYQPIPRFLIDKYLPTFIATRAIKL